MSTAHWVQTIIEVVLIVSLIIGGLYEPVLADWEEKQKEKVLKAFKKRKEYRR